MLGASWTRLHCILLRTKDTLMLYNAYSTMVLMQIFKIITTGRHYMMRQRLGMASPILFECCLSTMWMLILKTRTAPLQCIGYFSVFTSEMFIHYSHCYYWNMARTCTLVLT